MLRQHPEAVPNAVVELYRYKPAVISGSRSPEHDLEFHRLQLKAFVPVFLGSFSANNDPSAFDRPRQLDVLKIRDKPAFSFGNGRHSCVGRMIATIEQEELLKGILDYWDDFDIAESRFVGEAFQQGPEALKFAVTGR